MPKILIADDSITVRKVAERLLTEAGLDVVLASSGVDALERFDVERPDFVISDVIMPDKSGYEVCRFIRGHAELSATPVLLISGVVNEEVTRQTEACRADGVLKKPFQGTSLRDRVLELLEKHRQDSPPAPTPVVTEPPARVFRITEQQLETFRRASGRIRELEVELAAARARAIDTAQLETVQAELLAARDEAAAARRSREELQAALMTAQERLETQAAQLSEQSLRLADLEAKLTEAASAPQPASGEAGDAARLQARIAAMETLITEQRERATRLAHELSRVKQADERVQTLERALADEQTKTADMGRRLNALDESASRANARAEALAGVLAQIAALAGHALPPAGET